MLIPVQVLPFVLFLIVGCRSSTWVTGDKREHHLLQRPRNAPTRTAFLAALMTCYGLLWAAGGNDIMATRFPGASTPITYFMRAAVFICPVIGST